MGKKTIKQALKDLFLGLGGNVSELSDNTSVSDYIEDLESAISGAASGAAEDLIDDSASSESTTYSSSKIEELAGGSTVIQLSVSGSSISIENEMEFDDIVELVLSGANVIFRQVEDSKVIAWYLNQAYYIDIMGKTYNLNLYALDAAPDSNLKLSIVNFRGSKTSTITEKQISYNV